VNSLADLCWMIEEAGGKCVSSEESREKARQICRVLRCDPPDVVLLDFLGILIDERRTEESTSIDVECEPDCSRCSGEYCEKHGTSPRDCDTAERHETSE